MSTDMMLLTAFIQPQMEAHVVRALQDLPEFPGFSITDVRGQGRGKGTGGTYVPSESDLLYQRHLQLQIVCATTVLDRIVDAVSTAAWTGRKGDGVVFATPVLGFARIREAGAPAREDRR